MNDRMRELEHELEEVMFDATTTKFRRDRISKLLFIKVNVGARNDQDNARKSSNTRHCAGKVNATEV